MIERSNSRCSVNFVDLYNYEIEVFQQCYEVGLSGI